MQRRDFLASMGRIALGAAAASAVPAFAMPALAAPAKAAPTKTVARRSLSFVHLHTGERLNATYWADGRYDAAALSDINHVLRDWRTGEVGAIDPGLFDLLHDLRQRLGSDQPFSVICGYRCPKTNAMLASRSDGVARRSLHMDGKAIDIALPGRKLTQVREAALALARGGVGIYSRSGFVHVDTGRVRQWGS